MSKQSAGQVRFSATMDQQWEQLVDWLALHQDLERWTDVLRMTPAQLRSQTTEKELVAMKWLATVATNESFQRLVNRAAMLRDQQQAEENQGDSEC